MIRIRFTPPGTTRQQPPTSWREVTITLILAFALLGLLGVAIALLIGLQ